MLQKSVVVTAAWLEIVVGAVFLTACDVPSQLLFAAKPEGVGIVLARFAGVGLFALGVACRPSRAAESRRSAALGLFIFNFAVTILFAWVGVATALRGVLLWPVVALHSIIAIALLSQLLSFKVIGLGSTGAVRTGKAPR
ncbi:MAG: hypothetical protein WCC37_16850 [Candidatus Sulfotelmatobacter sp.]|jgi:hypothetical protein